MILRKPYVFFIKLFRPIHFIFAICIGILISSQGKIIKFLSSYLYSSELVDTTNIKGEFISPTFYLIPILLLILSLIIFGVMYKKNKPSKFYFASIFIFITILIINIYISNFFTIFEKNIVAIKVVKLMRDFSLISVIVELILMVIFISRGLGVNIKKFDFSSDISKFDINEEDKEEFELDIKIDFDKSKRNRNKHIRKLKYFYLENKVLLFIFLIIFIFIFSLIVLFFVRKKNFYNEKSEYNLNGFKMVVENTYLLNTNYEGIKITDNYLIVIDFKLKLYSYSNTLFTKDFGLKVGNVTFKPTKKYSNYLNDIGNIYNSEMVSNSYENYILVYEIPKKYITSEMLLKVKNRDSNINVKLRPKQIIYGNKIIESKLGKKINFKDSLGDIDFNIGEYEIRNNYRISYVYCLKNNECVDSFEYLRPSIDENYDKTILRLNLDYNNNTKKEINSFYILLKDYGDIYYKKGNEWKIQSDGFEQINLKRGTSNYVYIGIDKNIENSESIKFVFNIRGIKYEYLLK